MDKKLYHYAPYGRLGGILSALYIFLTGFLGCFFIYGPILPLVILWPWLFRRLTEVLASGWQTSIVVKKHCLICFVIYLTNAFCFMLMDEGFIR